MKFWHKEKINSLREEGFINNPEEISDLKSTINKFSLNREFFKNNKIKILATLALTVFLFYLML